MKKHFIISIIFCATAYSQSSPVQKDIIAIKKYVLKLNERIKDLEAKVKVLEKKLQEKKENDVAEMEVKAKLPPVLPVNPEFSKKANAVLLKRIKVPKKFTPALVNQYLSQIAQGTKDQSSWGSNDYQVYLIQQIPVEFMEQVINFQDHSIRFYIEWYVVNGLESKELALKYLLKMPEIVQKIQNRPDWQEEAWPILVAGLRTKNYLPREWLYLVASKDKKAGNDALLKQLELNCRLETLKAIQRTSLPEAAINKSIKKGWQAAQLDEHSIKAAAVCALTIGDLDALKLMMNTMKNPDKFDGYVVDQAKAVLITVFDTAEDPLKWYTKNRFKIKFDQVKRKFIAR